ncbi:MAG: bifunctional folylpolyglutamate synthase/dihydrofolate synthase [Eudoraea sp.]|nr:bifunctional folylpolyglutamate synthase/dihydrofolate synthase [Eudoraea sp.]
MTYQETLDWMFAQLPMYQERGTAAYNGKLDGIKAFSKHLGEPQTKFKSIHVAGTNGKGSSSHMLASIFQEAGYKVGLYTSPHLKDFRERIKINGKVLSKQQVIGFIQANRSYIETNKLSFFEMTVAMAFDHFAEEQVAIAIIEVGLGGRLDSTNIIRPEVCLITNIGLDHTDMLGDTLPEIAREKAGIIKSHIPVVISERQKDTGPVFNEIAQLKKAPIIFAEDSISGNYQTDLLGSYQKKNVKGVIATLHELEGYTISETNMKAGLANVVENTGLLGRWQVLGEQPKIICDTAHNSESLSLVMNQLLREKYKRLHIVLGFVMEKDMDSILSLFPKDAHFYFCRPNIPRGLKAEVLHQKATAFGLEGTVYKSVADGFEAVKLQASEEDLIFIGGSTFTVAEVV